MFEVVTSNLAGFATVVTIAEKTCGTTVSEMQLSFDRVIFEGRVGCGVIAKREWSTVCDASGRIAETIAIQHHILGKPHGRRISIIANLGVGLIRAGLEHIYRTRHVHRLHVIRHKCLSHTQIPISHPFTAGHFN